MAKTDFKCADEYIAAQPAAAREVLRTVRQTIRDAVPDAEEVISYQLPAFKLNGGWIFYLGGFKNHFSLACPPPLTHVEAFKEQLARYEVTKSAIRFPLSEPVPVELIAEMARFRGQECRPRVMTR